MPKAINWDDELPPALEAFYELNHFTANKREIPKASATLYWVYSEYNNKPVTITWADDFMGRTVVWAYGEVPADRLVRDYLRGA